jgi:hypothetical protein
MSRPGVARTAVEEDFAGVGERLVVQLATSSAKPANAISFRGLFIGNARIT